MEITRSGVAALVLLCGAAGAGGTYLVTRGPAAAGTDSGSAAGTSTIAEPTAVTPSSGFRADRDRIPAASTRGETRGNRTQPNQAPQDGTPVPAPPPLSAPVADAGVPGTDAVPPPPVTLRTTADAQAADDSALQTDDARARAREPEFEELVIARDVVLGLEFENTLTSDAARLEDQVVARVTRDVRVGDRIALPAGARAYGEVTEVERGGRLRQRARLGVRFTSIVLSDGTRVPMATDVIVREGDSPTRESAAKIGGGAIGGAIIGGILGGGKGAIIGSTAGAGAGTAAVMVGGRNAAAFTAGTPVTVRLTEPVAVRVNR